MKQTPRNSRYTTVSRPESEGKPSSSKPGVFSSRKSPQESVPTFIVRDAPPADETPILVSGRPFDRDSLDPLEDDDEAVIIPASPTPRRSAASSPRRANVVVEFTPAPLAGDASSEERHKEEPSTPLSEESSTTLLEEPPATFSEEPPATFSEGPSTTLSEESPATLSGGLLAAPVVPAQVTLPVLKLDGAARMPEIIAAPDYSNMSEVERESTRTRIKINFQSIATNFPVYGITPADYADETPLEVLYVRYENYVRNIRIRREMESYKIFLVIGWLLTQVLLKRMKLPIDGYIVNQIRMMSNYDRMLEELAETNYTQNQAAIAAGESSAMWGPLWRIAFVSLFHAFVLVLVNFFTPVLGASNAREITGSIVNYLTDAVGSNSSAGAPGGAAAIAAPTSGLESLLGGGGGGLGSILGSLMSGEGIGSIIGSLMGGSRVAVPAANDPIPETYTMPYE